MLSNVIGNNLTYNSDKGVLPGNMTTKWGLPKIHHGVGRDSRGLPSLRISRQLVITGSRRDIFFCGVTIGKLPNPNETHWLTTTTPKERKAERDRDIKEDGAGGGAC